MPLPRVNNAVQRYFIEDLTRNGLDEVGPEGIEKLRRFVADNDIDGFEVRPQPGGGISATETGYLKDLLRNNELRAFLTGDGQRALETQLNLHDTIYGGLSGHEVSMPQGTVTRIDLTRVPTPRLAAAFASEVEARADIFQNPRVSAEEKGQKLYLLFKDYATELNKALRRSAALRNARRDLLRTLDEIPAARVLLLQDSDGDSFNDATELVFGTNPGKPENEFPARKTAWSTYQNMHGSFYTVADKIDQVLKGRNLPAEVAAHEHRSAVAWLMGERGGNTITGTLMESRAISSTAGLDFVKGLFSPTDRVAKLKLVDGFGIAVDFLDPSGGFVTFDRSAGDQMQAIDKGSGAVLSARIEEVPVDGEPLPRYRPIFQNASGEVVPEGGVKLVISDRTGRVKGDGKTEGSHDAGWWGFCDRNALNLLVTTGFGYPAPEQDVTIETPGGPVMFTARDILDVVGRRMTELFSRFDYTGERFDDVLSQITLKDGSYLLGRLRGNIDTARPDLTREGDLVTISAQNGEDPFGRVVVRIARKAANAANETFLEATTPRGEKFAVKAEDIPGGFQVTQARPIAWRVSAADNQAIADLVLPVADAQKVGRNTVAPTADALRAYVTSLLDRAAATPDFNMEMELYRDHICCQPVVLWAQSLEGAETRVEQFLPVFAELKQIYATQSDAEVRGAAITALAARDIYARLAISRLSGFMYQFRTDLVGDSDNVFWNLSDADRLKRFFQWYDPADTAKVSRLRTEIISIALHKNTELILRTVPRDEILTGVESERAALEAKGNEEHQSYMPQLRAALARIDEISTREDMEYDGTETGRPVTTYVLRLAPQEGQDSRWPQTYTVSETQLHFDRVSLWSSNQGSPELQQLRDALVAKLRALVSTAAVTKTEDEMTFPSPPTIPKSFEVSVSDGTTRTIRSSDIQTLVREEADDVPFEELIAHVKRHDGVTNADSWMSEGVSNGLRVFTAVRDYSPTDRDAPSWISAMKDRPLFGRYGQVKRLDRVRFYDLGNESEGYWSSGTRGWIEFDRDNNPVNSSVIQGMYDFLWSVEGKPDWSLPPTFNPHVPNDLVLTLYLRSVADHSKLEALANDGLLPANWRDYLA